MRADFLSFVQDSEQNPILRHSMYYHMYQEVILMKIVVVKSNRFLSGVLRLVFGIKKEYPSE